MDDIVKQAMVKWPNVPHCYGWLALDARGNWYMRDDAAQAAGAKGSLLKHEKLIDFIQRNYACDAAGQWYFQNGPQRVYVELEAAPWVWRINDAGQVFAHDGRSADYQRCVVDEHGWLYLETSIGFGLVHTQDVQLAADVIDAGTWTVHEALRTQLPIRYGFVTSPQALVANKA